MKSSQRPVRGRVYGATLPGIGTEKFFLVVSNNTRNERLPSVLALRLTTSSKPAIATVVPLLTETVFRGSVLCDDVVEIFHEEITRDLGALSRSTMARVNHGLKVALGL